jgi:glycine cleavage system H protein
MSAELIFPMGKFEAKIPTDREYFDNHLWSQEHNGVRRVGLTAYSVRLLQDVYFLSWSIDPRSRVKKKQELGEIESSKAVSSLYAPQAGTVGELNELVLGDPSHINTDGYGKGWLYEFDSTEGLLTAEQYVELLDSVWEKTQRVIKGQLNE